MVHRNYRQNNRQEKQYRKSVGNFRPVSDVRCIVRAMIENLANTLENAAPKLVRVDHSFRLTTKLDKESVLDDC